MINNQDNFRLHLIVGEDVPLDAPKQFHMVSMYIRNKEGKLDLYAELSLPYLINHWEFLNNEDDPRYFFSEGYDPKTKIRRYRCEIQPLGNMKGVYRILDGQRIKIMSIEPLCKLENNVKTHILINKH